jgi:5-oxoprolinase (ATP-hydrolysing) subunit C
MGLLVHSAGTYSLLVDFGRPRSRSLGVPVGGAADRSALALGNALVGNAPDAAGLEITLAGPTLEATERHGCVVTGAPFSVWVNERPQPIGETFTLQPGDLLTIGTTDAGLRAYLCVRGGVASPLILDSHTGLDPLHSKAELTCAAGGIHRRFFRGTIPGSESPHRLRVLCGAHAEPACQEALTAQAYSITAESDRMGIRLAAAPLPRRSEELLSEPVCPGTVQLTHEGQAIILGVDAQTIGGYARIAHVIAADLDKLAQLRPGDQIHFEWVSLPVAQQLFRARQAVLRDWVTRLRSSLY